MGMTDYTETSTITALAMARRKPKAQRKRSKAWMIPATLLVLLVGGLFIQDAAKAAVADAVAPAVTATDALASEAQALTEQYEAICQAPALAEAEALTAGTGSAEAFDAITGDCTDFAVENADFVQKVEAATLIWTDLGDGFVEVTETVRAAVEAGDIEEAIRILFAQSETEAN